MTINRLRPAPTVEQLDAMYPEPHDHRMYGRGHRLRVDLTKQLAAEARDWDPQNIARSVADLSCGNGEIALSLGMPQTVLGDYAAGHQLVGPIEHTLGEIHPVDLFICSETLEHLDDPGAVLAVIRERAGRLVLSTPLDAWEDTNAEHLWAWDRDGVESWFRSAGWAPLLFASLDTRVYGEPYLYGVWICE